MILNYGIDKREVERFISSMYFFCAVFMKYQKKNLSLFGENTSCSPKNYTESLLSH